MDKEILFSVVIVSYKNVEILKDTLDSLKKYNDLGEALEVIVVDNSPEDDLYNYVRAHYPQVTIIKNENKGFGHGNNAGVKLAKGKYLLLLNPDTILVEPIFKFAIGAFEKDPKLGLFGVKLVDKELKRNHSFYFMEYSGFLAAQVEKMANAMDGYIHGKMFIAGANLFVRKEVFIQCGGFDEKIFMYSEEADLTRRVIGLGYRTTYFKEKMIIHLEGKTTVKNLKMEKVRLESKAYYSAKYGLNYRKRLVEERNYDKLKILIFKVKSPDKVKALQEKVAMLNQLIKKEDDRLE